MMSTIVAAPPLPGKAAITGDGELAPAPAFAYMGLGVFESAPGSAIGAETQTQQVGTPFCGRDGAVQ